MPSLIYNSSKETDLNHKVYIKQSNKHFDPTISLLEIYSKDYLQLYNNAYTQGYSLQHYL